MMIYHQAQPWNTLGFSIKEIHLRRGGTHTMRFPLGIESNLINWIAVTHAIMEQCFVNDHMVCRQFLESVPLSTALGDP